MEYTSRASQSEILKSLVVVKYCKISKILIKIL